MLELVGTFEVAGFAYMDILLSLTVSLAYIFACLLGADAIVVVLFSIKS